MIDWLAKIYSFQNSRLIQLEKKGLLEANKYFLI